MKVLNLYSGVGGNRKLWKNCKVVAVESNEKIARVYQRLHPNDEVVIGDAHEYLREHFSEFDFIWSSPPFQTHSQVAKATRRKVRRYPDMRLYEEILFLQHFFEGDFVVENVWPFYEPLIKPTKRVGRHLFWSNFDFDADNVKKPRNFLSMANLEAKKTWMDWLGIHYEENIYHSGNPCPAKVLRNCVHPEIGRQIFEYKTKNRSATDE